MDPYRSLCEADAEMLVRLEFEDMVARLDDRITSLGKQRAIAIEHGLLPELMEDQRRSMKIKANLVRILAKDRITIPRAMRPQASAG